MVSNSLDWNIIYNNKFSIQILSLMEETISLNQKNDKLNSKQLFITDIFNSFVEISEKFDDINYSYLHILNYPANPKYRKIFPIQKYNIYHTEIYCMKIIALFDRFLHLINMLYQLNLKGSWLKLSNIKKDQKVDKNVLTVLEKFNIKIKTIRDWQNYFKHEWSLDIPQLQKISSYELLLNHSKNLNENQKKQMKLYIKLEYEKYKWIQKEALLQNTKWIADFINKILDELFPVFENRLSRIK